MKTKKTFLFKEPEKTHIIKLKQKKYWWLLLFLLLILLFLKINFNVEYQIFAEGTEIPVEKVNVKILYTENSEDFDFIKETKKNGTVKFKVKSKRLYEYLIFWKKDKDFEIKAIVFHSCYKDNELIEFYDILKKQVNIIYINNNEPVKIIVKDIKSGKLLRNTNIELDIGNTNVGSGKTDNNGVLNYTLPLCNDLIISSKKKNYADTIYSYKIEKSENDSLQELIVYMRPLAKDYIVSIQKCYNAGRDHYDVFIDGEFIMYHRTTSGGDLPNSGDGEAYQKDEFIIPLSIGKHIVELKLKQEYVLGTCGSCSQIKIPDINFREYFERSFGSSKKDFSWEIEITE